MKHAVKLSPGSDSQVEGLAVPFGGPWVGADGQGRDLYGEYFSAKTELCLDWYPARPLLYQHGFDEGTKVAPVGQVKAWEVRSDGVWVQAQLDASSDYFDAIAELIEKGKLFFSSGSMSHLVQTAKSGEILRWPWTELSLTPSPANLYATLDQPTAEKHWQEAGLPVKALREFVKALPTEPVVSSGRNGYDPPEGSYEALIRKLDRAVNALLCPGYSYDDDLWCYVIATFPDYLIACAYGNGVRYYQIEYTLGADGAITLGECREAQLAYIPVDDLPADEAPMAVMSAHTIRSATALLERTKDLRERRARDRRALSDQHRDRVKATRDRLADLLGDFDALLAAPASTATDEAKARSVVEVQAAYAQILALASGVEVPA